MSRRRLTPDEIALWRSVADRTDRLHPETSPAPRPMPKPTPVKPAMPSAASYRPASPARPRPVAFDLAPALPDRLKAAPLQMDRKAFGRMKRGKMVPEGRVDLHGMTLDRAHGALNRFILSAQAQGKRLVLVITGKGRGGPTDDPIPRPRGVLKHQVPHWLTTPPLAQAVLQITEAHTSHGGTGAYYVYLRKGS
ncbi:MAG: Smr/MutS family protein [Maritimibacter sp.]|nr:Smr/MutS family protein [Sedimentitalea sp.]MCB1355267.1 Smr/MutS family protein [Maritimibacter sp.]